MNSEDSSYHLRQINARLGRLSVLVIIVSILFVIPASLGVIYCALNLYALNVEGDKAATELKPLLERMNRDLEKINLTNPFK